MRGGRGRFRSRGGRGRDASRGQLDPQAQKQALYRKFMRDPNVSMDRKFQAFRFIEGMETFDSKPRLVTELMDGRNHGRQRIEEILSFLETVEDVRKLLLPLLGAAINNEMMKPLHRELRSRFLHTIYVVPSLLDFLARDEIVSAVSTDVANVLCSFLLEISKAYGEARNSDGVSSLASKLRGRGDVHKVDILFGILLADEKEQLFRIKSERLAEPVAKRTRAACTALDCIPAGGRHDNDHFNYRDISILPTTEELRSAERPYLPLAKGENSTIVAPVTRLLDRNFRLLREDAISAMRECLSEPKRVWKNARVVGIDLDGYCPGGSVAFIVQVDHPGGSVVDWAKTKALMRESVVAFLDEDGQLIRTGVISVRRSDERGSGMNHRVGPMFGVSFAGSSVFDEVMREMVWNRSLLDQYDSAMQSNNRRKMEMTMRSMKAYSLVEISKSFFSYQPVLKALQNVEALPFPEELIECRSQNDSMSYLPEQVRFPSGVHFHGYQCGLSLTAVDDLTNKTSLDNSQARAVVHALTSRVALIQGPPGTGKTFIGGLIAQVILQNSDAKILCVCYTNHALDQFLEHMLDYGETRIVRIGGRSKSERVAPYNLRALSSRNQAARNDWVSSRIRQVDAQIYRQRELVREFVGCLEQKIGWASPNGGVRAVLEMEFPDALQFLVVSGETEFELVGPGGKKISDDFLWKRWRDGQPFPDWLLPYFGDIDSDALFEFWSRDPSARELFVNDIEAQVAEVATPALHSALDELMTLSRERECLRQSKDKEALQRSRVIGATTSGAAKYRELLSEVSPEVVIVEEAGEVLEAHVLAALSADSGTTTTKHLVLIGDHKQLRPKLESYSLSEVAGHGFDLDVSLFERLIIGGLESVALEVQHRMRPSISSIIRHQTYPRLVDHESVEKYPPIRGVDSSVDGIIFIDHRCLEDSVVEDTFVSDRSTSTKANSYEVDLSIEIVRFLLLQGYNPDRIVVLTPYVGQLMQLLVALRTKLAEVQAYVSEQDLRDLEDVSDDVVNDEGIKDSGSSIAKSVRISTVDNFQGEESDIVVATLVRSNKRGNIGFLKEKQRANVLLSRARHGMILIGNTETLLRKESGRSTWEPIVDLLKERGQVRDGLPTICQIHPQDPPISLCNPKDFRAWRPNGGCQRPCLYRLPCGHVCPQMCHPVDRTHEVAQRMCQEPCRRIPPECTEGHLCMKRCREECGRCMFPAGLRELPCGHITNSLVCHDVRTNESLAQLPCKELVTVSIEACGHTVETTCSNARSVKPRCPSECGTILNCGHPCKKRCGSCDDDHKCSRKCERSLFCGHLCGQQCHADRNEGCPSCKSRCANQCIHSRCPKPCSEPCASCVEPCDWACEHKGSCSLVCGAPCTRLPCNMRCNNTLECGHRCPSVCGETCPGKAFCKECGSARNLSHIVDMIEFREYRDHEVDKDPIIVLPCRHFFTMTTLDGIVEIDKAYKRSSTSSDFVGVHPIVGSDITEKARQCPDCRAAIHSINRYARITNFSLLRSLERKHLMLMDSLLNGSAKMEAKERSVEKLEKVLVQVKRSPMQQVFDACGREGETPAPPTRPILRCLQLLGESYASRVEKAGDKCFENASKAYEEAILYASASKSSRLEAVNRLALARLHLPWADEAKESKQVVTDQIDVVLDMNLDFVPNLISEAKAMKESLSDATRRKVMAEVMQTIDGTGGYNYGTNSSDHWYFCPNGHPYYIGECGGAMQESLCIDCGERVGGRDHTLLSSNSRWTERQNL